MHNTWIVSQKSLKDYIDVKVPEDLCRELRRYQKDNVALEKFSIDDLITLALAKYLPEKLLLKYGVKEFKEFRKS